MSELMALAVHGDAFVYRGSEGTVLVDGGDVRGHVIGVIYEVAPTKAANWLPIFASSKLG
jgi:hypothetical protein